MVKTPTDDTGPGAVFRTNVATGGIVGAAASVCSYVLTYLFVTVDGADGAGGTATWKLVGQTLYNAQLVPTEFSTSGRTETANFVTKRTSDDRLVSAVYDTPIGDTVPALVYHLAPLVVLAVAGFLAARTAQSRLDVERSAAAGLTIVPGTLVLSIVGVVLFESSPGGGSTSFAPDPLLGVLLAGLLLPAAAGTIGGVVSAYT